MMIFLLSARIAPPRPRKRSSDQSPKADHIKSNARVFRSVRLQTGAVRRGQPGPASHSLTSLDFDRQSLTVTDNRSGETYEVDIASSVEESHPGVVPASKFKKLR